MKFIDSHCHLYSEEFDNDRAEIVSRAIHAGVSRMYLPAIDSTSHAAMLQLEAGFPENCFAMMGLHPCSVTDNYTQELAIAENFLQQKKFCAIGEIGLDFYWDTTFAAQQYIAFKQQMQWALDLHLPIVIHTRNAIKETIETVAPFAAKGLRGIFHCFGGSMEEAAQITGMGFLLGIGGVLTYKKSGLQQVMQQVSLDHVVLETDAPYLTPVPYRGKRNESSYIPIIAQMLADVKQTSIENVAAITTANAEKIFGAR